MSQHRIVAWGLGVVVALVLFGLPGGAGAQWGAGEAGPLQGMDLGAWLAAQPVPEVAPLDSTTPRTFGPASEVARVVPASQFEAQLSTDPWLLVPVAPPTAGLLRVPGAPINLWAGLELPAGALITRIELDGCDLTGGGQIAVALLSFTSPAGATPLKLLGLGATGTAATPGCALFAVPLAAGLTPADLTVDNAAHYYSLFLNMNAPGLAFANVRVFYKLQVSPAPAVATFGDVPTTHPFFRFIEALVKSGITSGCGGGNYCPDRNLTRGEMAVFLATGLGLHTAP